MLVGEGANLLAVDRECTDQLVVLEQRNVEYCPKAPEADRGDENRLALDVGRLLGDVDYMNRFLRLGDAAERGARTGPLWSALPELGKRRRDAEHRVRTPRAILKAKQNPETGLADAHGICQHGLKHQLQLAGRCADNLENLGGGGELFQRLVPLAGELYSLGFLAGSGGTATGHGLCRNATL